MANMKHTPKTYAQAVEALNGRDSVKLGNNTWLIDCDDYIAVRLHNTHIVKFYSGGLVTLHTGGFYSVTTKSRMNQFIRANVYQRAHQWYVCLADGVEVIFSEGLDVSA